MEELRSYPAGEPGNENKQHVNFTLCSGIGQHHSNEIEVKARKDYLTIDWSGIQSLVDRPQEVDKAQARWLIPSSYPSRKFKAQEEHGQYWLLWADLDDKPPTIADMKTILAGLLSDCNYEIYNSRGATEDNQKARILIPLDKPLCYVDWHLAQQTLNDKLDALGIIPDRASERAAQLCYLPNHGDIYDCWSVVNSERFRPMQSWRTEIALKRQKIEADRLALEQVKHQTMAKRSALNGKDSIIDAFNKAYTPQEFLLGAGYKQRGATFCHPNSGGGSYSAGVKEIDGLLRVNALSPNDPLCTDGKGAHDAFSAFTILNHSGDRDAALKDAGDNLLAIGVLSWNEDKQREYAKANGIPEMHHHDEEGWKKEKPQSFDLTKFSLAGQLNEMRQKMLADKFVLNGLAIYGQATVFYAPPNSGKTLLTLKLLIEGIEAGEIAGDAVFYINADDSYKGLVNKLELAEKHGFNMLAPGHMGFESKQFVTYLRKMISEGSASGKIIILDTLKKFTDTMDKKIASDFMRAGREFVSNGGTLILLAHTNKKRDNDGKPIYGGTSDIVDDVDCAYILDPVKPGPFDSHKTVLLENIKSRGDVERSVGYSYLIDPHDYGELLNSVKPIIEKDVKAALEREKTAAQEEKDRPLIQCNT